MNILGSEIMQNEIKVAFDIDTLGLGFYNPHERTGVHRVVENIAEGLFNSDCHVQFYANDYVNDVIAYLKTENKFGSYEITRNVESKGSLSYSLNSLVKKQASAILKKYNEGKQPYRQLMKIYRSLPFTMNKLMPRNSSTSNELDQVLKQANIYHSPYSKITEHVNSFHHLKHFITIHDLIPILYPVGNSQKSSSGTKDAVESLKKEHWIFTVSQATKDDLCNYRRDIDPNKVIVNYLGASKDNFYPCSDVELIADVKKKYKIPADAVYFLGLSNPSPHKNFEGLIKGFYSLLRQQNLPDAYLVVVGRQGQGYENILAQTSIDEKLKGRVIFTGRVEDEELAALYSGALCFTFVSHYEGFGLPPLEAMQCGVPVIAANTSSLPEVVGNAGILVDPKEESALCQAMLSVYKDSDLRAQMSGKSIQQAAKFSWEHCVQQTIDGYKLAMNS